LSIELKPLYEKWHAAGLEIIGVSFDKTADAAEKACKRNGFPWPQVMVPTDAKTRELWQTATGIDVLPRVLLIDSNGILRSDSPQRLEEEIAKLLRDSPSHP
jgi:hypothetical protein